MSGRALDSVFVERMIRHLGGGAPRDRAMLRSTTALSGWIGALPALVVGASLVAPEAARANPDGGNVVAGQATIVNTSDVRLDVIQSTDKAIIDWRSFDVGVDEHTNFDQPSSNSITLNRVTGGTDSSILGQITADGRIILVNPNGVFIGKDATIDVNGLVASTGRS